MCFWIDDVSINIAPGNYTREEFALEISHNSLGYFNDVSYNKNTGKLDFKNQTSLFTEVDFRVLNRESSTVVNPKENYILNFNKI